MFVISPDVKIGFKLLTYVKTVTWGKSIQSPVQKVIVLIQLRI